MNIVKMIELTDMEGNSILVNPETIEFVYQGSFSESARNRLIISFKSGESISVMEPIQKFYGLLERYNLEIRQESKDVY